VSKREALREMGLSEQAIDEIFLDDFPVIPDPQPPRSSFVDRILATPPAPMSSPPDRVVRRIAVEVYSRVVGYFRPVNQWNKGKREEFGERKPYSLGGGRFRG
jgi:hypothetical protein